MTFYEGKFMVKITLKNRTGKENFSSVISRVIFSGENIEKSEFGLSKVRPFRLE